MREAEKSPSPGCPAHPPAAAALPPGCFPLLAPARAWDAINLLVARAWRSHFWAPAPPARDPEGPGLPWWLWVPALPPTGAGAYPAEVTSAWAIQATSLFVLETRLGFKGLIF